MAGPPGIELRSATVEELELPLVRPFTTSFGTERSRRVLLLALEERGGEVGWAECVAGRDPLYSYESEATVRQVLSGYLLPALRQLGRRREGVGVAPFLREASRIRGHPMAKALVEMALQDLTARLRGVPLGRQLLPRGPLRTRVEVGVSIGIQPSPRLLVQQVRDYREQGYGRVKVKIEPGRDAGHVRAVRREFPQVPLWADANQAYGKEGLPCLRGLCESAELELLEQPFPEDAWQLHARLARALPRGTRLCLDESVVSPAHLELALSLGAIGSLNIKPGRVGGLSNAVALHDRARGAGLAVWCGGMLESGVGRAHNLHLASLPGFRLPSDLSASSRYWREDLVEPPFGLEPGSCLRVPVGTGCGVEPVEARLRRHRVRRRVVRFREWI